MSAAKKILEEALSLPEQERQKVALTLLDSISGFDPHAGMTDQELATEIVRRADDAAAGRTRGISSEEALQQIRAKLAR